MDDLRLRFDKEPGAGPLMANCVYHQDDTASMAVYADHVWCFGCQTYKWADEFNEQTLATRRTTHAKSERRAEYLPRSMAETYHRWLFAEFSVRLEYLHARGLRDDTLRANLIGHCGNAFTIPVFDEDGNLVAIRYRRDDLWAESRVPKYWGTPGKNDCQLYEPYWPVGPYDYRDYYLCEGELDALRLAQEGYHAISLTNGAGAVKHLDPKWGDLADHIYLLFDQDEAGDKAREIAAKTLPNSVSVHWPPSLGKDVTEFLQRWPLTALERYIKNAKQVTHTPSFAPSVGSGAGSTAGLRSGAYVRGDC